VIWLVSNLNLGSRERALAVGQQLIDEKLMHHVYNEPFRDGYFFYRFQEDVPNLPAFNMKRIWNLPARPISQVANDLVQMIGDLFEKYLSEDGKTLNFELEESEEFRKFALATSELQSIDLFALKQQEKLALFLNLYNMLVIHANVVVGPPVGLIQRTTYFSNAKYQIGRDIYSLDDIEHGILRGNQSPPGSLFKPFSSNDSRLPHIMSKDCRIHFALNCGAKSCPPLRTFSFENIDGALTFAAESFIDDNVIIDISKKLILISKIFSWYKSDFGKSDKDLLLYLAKFMDKKTKEELISLIENGKYSLKFQDYDWTPMYYKGSTE